VRHILRRRLAAASVGRKLLCGYADDGVRLDGRAADGEGVRHIERPGGKASYRRVEVEEKILRPRGERAGTHEHLNIVRHLLSEGLRPFRHSRGLIDHDRGVRRKIVQRGRQLAVDHVRVAVRGAQLGAARQPLRILAQRGRELL
jgi:hypothetical protein